MNTVRAHEIELAYEWIGEGDPPMIVIPQWFLSSRSMRASALVRALARHHRMLLYDRRGTGMSEKPGPPYSVARDARDLGAMVEAFGLFGFVLLGHGVRGSQVAMNFAGHFPGRVRGLILLGATPRWMKGPEWPYGVDEATWEDALGSMSSSDEPPPGASIAIEQDWEACGPEAARDILLKTRDEDLRPFLPKVTSPALVIHLKGDRIVPFEAARWLAESLPNGVLEEFDAPREIPFRGHAELAEHIEEFLRITARG